MGKIIRCVLTGGPCGGKSSAADYVKRSAQLWGVKVLFVPEVYTVVVANGVEYPGESDSDALFDFQKIVLRLQIEMENTFNEFAEQYAAKGEKVLVLLDRGFVDVKAYTPANVWRRLLRHFGFETEEVLMARYDMILHMDSVAVDAEHYYSTEGHTTRYETVDESKELDSALVAAWIAHPSHFRIDNSAPSTNPQSSSSNAVSIAADFHSAATPQAQSFLYKMHRVCELLHRSFTSE